MAKAKSVSMNAHVWVMLTKHGEWIYHQELRRVENNVAELSGKKAPKRAPKIKKTAGGYIRLQLWDLMRIFGPHCEIGVTTVPFGEVFLSQPE